MSLRTKFMLALLLTGLAAVAMVGGLAYVGMTKKVDLIRREQAAAHFYTAVSGYLHTYGSWRAAMAVEPFDNYMRRYQDLRGDRRPPPGEDGPDGER
ncbi:MAG TPA: GGDEF domain-containing protein, partial [Duganella sp.]|nr:GGDEF domain-containing protein [Duganella sp.]